MKASHITPLLSLATALAAVFFMGAGYAADPAKPALSDPAIEAALQAQVDPQESVALQGMIDSDLEANYPGKEKVVLWTVLGATYWSNKLSVMSGQAGKWLTIATQDLGGMIPGLDAATSDGVIILNAKVPGPDDPVCCPTLQKTLKYRYAHGQIIELR